VDAHTLDTGTTIAVIIPVFNEQDGIAKVLADIPPGLKAAVFVVDNGSTDSTAAVAAEMGAHVIAEPQKGYGSACLAGIHACCGSHVDEGPDIIVFLDGDYSDHPNEMYDLVRPILEDGVEMVIGSRSLGDSEPGALLPQARFGNWLATRLIRLFFGFRYSDLGPFRAIRTQALLGLGMKDRTFGWTVEMQVKALLMKLRVAEVPVSYRRRIGVSKITGTLTGTVKAGWMILYTIFRYRLFPEDALTPPISK